jgi:hypothetical protein
MPLVSRVPGILRGSYKSLSARRQLGLGLYARNLLHNGDFLIAQRGTSFDTTTTPANNDDTYLLDRWKLLSDGNDRVDVSQETSVVPTGARAAIKLDLETLTAGPNSEKSGIIQYVENENCLHVVGDVVSLSFEARITGSSIGTIRAGVMAWDSTADTVTSTPIAVAGWNAAGTDPTLVANWTWEGTAAFTPTTSYQRFKMEGIRIDTASTANLGVMIWIDDTDLTAGEFLYISEVQFEAGGMATPFERRSIGEELSLCQRYYWKSFQQGTAPADGAGLEGSITAMTTGTAAADLQTTVQLPQVMRAAPTIATFNPSDASPGALDDWRRDDATNILVTNDNVGDAAFRLLGNEVTSDSASHRIHATADADL